MSFVKTIVMSLSLVLAAGAPALAGEPGSKPSKAAKTSSTSSQPLQKPQQSAEEVMKISQQAMQHISAAQTALDKGDKAAAKKALVRSEQALDKLYDTPFHAAIINELDEAIATIGRNQPGQDKAGGAKAEGQPDDALIPMDLAPLSASMRRYQAYVDPSVISQVDEAAAKAKDGDAAASAEALRLARNRVAIDLAFLPVEEAYMRVLAAQQMLSTGDTRNAAKLVRGIPVVVSQVQVSTPLVPIRFSLTAAAEAAEQGNITRARELLRGATQDLERLERVAPGSELNADLGRLSDDAAALGKRMSGEGDGRAHATAIRDLAKRTRDLGA